MEFELGLLSRLSNSDLFKVNLIFRALFVFLGLISFLLFRSIELNDLQRVSQSVTAMLRNETNLSNSYAISKTLFDLERIGLFKCARLTEIAVSGRIFYDTTSHGKCEGKSFFVNGSLIRIKGSNGVSYELYFLKDWNVFAYLLEAITYLILIVLGVYLPRSLQQMVEKERARNAILEIERSALYETARQVSHDVASPLSAIRMMMSLLNNIDPEIKKILNKALARTQDIFDDMRVRKVELGTVEIYNCIDEIISEKQMRWMGSPRIKIDRVYGNSIVAIGTSQDFKRIISNILDNAAESISHDRGLIQINSKLSEDLIIISIVDNGKGMSPDILEKLGTRGFSVGKESHRSAGSGLGVYHAMNTLKSWGGGLSFKSGPQGTSADIRLRKI